LRSKAGWGESGVVKVGKSSIDSRRIERADKNEDTHFDGAQTITIAR